MPGKIVYKVTPPPPKHTCSPPEGCSANYELPYVGGTIWECECGQQYKLFGMLAAGAFYYIFQWRKYPKWYDRFYSFLNRVK